jgi:hypothetical protein
VAGLAVAGTEGSAAALVAIDQDPILRVVRSSDLSSAKNLEPPSGALTARQLASNYERGRSPERAFVAILDAGGFRSSAISAFEGPGHMVWTSTAAEFGSPAQACLAVAPLARLDAHALAPSGAHATVSLDTDINRSRIVTYTPPHPGWAGGVEVIACSGDYVYTLRDIGKPAALVTQQPVDALLAKVIARRR